MDPEKMARKRSASSACHLRDRETRRASRNDRIGAPVFVNLFEELFLERQILGERLENQSGFGNRFTEVGVIAAKRDSLADRFCARIVLHFGQPRRGLVAPSRQHRDAISGARKYACSTGAHGAVRANDYDPYVLSQVVLRSR